MTFLQGKKTYLVAVAGLVTVGAYLLHLISIDTANVLLGIFGFGGIISLRSAIANA